MDTGRFVISFSLPCAELIWLNSAYCWYWYLLSKSQDRQQTTTVTGFSCRQRGERERYGI
eukprot:scaffold2632_cov158-Amphora_coffeaeformis.AAC.8